MSSDVVSYARRTSSRKRLRYETRSKDHRDDDRTGPRTGGRSRCERLRDRSIGQRAARGNATFLPGQWRCHNYGVECFSGDAFPYAELTTSRGGGITVKVQYAPRSAGRTPNAYLRQGLPRLRVYSAVGSRHHPHALSTLRAMVEEAGARRELFIVAVAGVPRDLRDSSAQPAVARHTRRRDRPSG